MENTSSGLHSLPSLSQSLRHHWGVIAICVVSAVLLASGYAFTTTKTYTATAQVLLYPSPGNPLTPDAANGSGTQLTIAMETEAGIVKTPEVSQKASEKLSRVAPDNGERLSVSVPSGTQIVEVEFTSEERRGSAEGAQSFATSYLEYRQERAESTQEESLAALRSQRDTADEGLRRASSEAADAGVASYASQEVQLFTGRLAQLNDDISAAEAVATDSGRVINPANTPGRANELPAPFFLLAAAALGLLAGVGLALLREWRRDLVREEEETEITGIPVFATLPPNETGLVVGNGVDQMGHEAYRRLRAGIVANGPRPHVLAVTAVDVDGHASAVTSNLAVALAEARFSVLIVAADPDDRGVERILGVSTSPGLSEAVRDGLSARETLVRAAGVTVLPGGSNPISVRELYAGPAFRRVVDSMRDQYDYIVLGAASAGTGDGDAVIAAADSALLAVTSSRTTYAQVSAALERFVRLGIQPLGSVITPPNESAQGHRSARARRRLRRSSAAMGADARGRELTHDPADTPVKAPVASKKKVKNGRPVHSSVLNNRVKAVKPSKTVKPDERVKTVKPDERVKTVKPDERVKTVKPVRADDMDKTDTINTIKTIKKPDNTDGAMERHDADALS